MRIQTRFLLATVLVALPISATTGVAWAANATVNVVNNTSNPYDYDPSNVTIAVGDTVTFTNPRIHSNGGTATEHPTACRPETSRGKTKGDCPWSTENVDPGTSRTVAFPAEGTFQYLCLVHPYMLGTIVVGDGTPGDPPPSPTAQPSPTTKPSPTATATTAPASPSPSAATSAPGTPSPSSTHTPAGSNTATPDATPDATLNPTVSPSSSATPTPSASPTVAGSDDGDDGDDDGSDNAIKALALLLVVGTGAALTRFRRA